MRMRSRGFTLVELLVVVAIIGLLIGITLPAIQSVRAAARRTLCSNRIRQVGLAVQAFESTFGRFPVGIHDPNAVDLRSISWLTQLLPYIEQQNLWNTVDASFQTQGSPFLHVGLQTPVKLFQCPSDPRSGESQFTHGGLLIGLTSFLGVNGTDYRTEDGVFYQNSETRAAEIRDGLSNTVMIGERPASADNWYGWWYAGLGQQASGSPDMLLGSREVNDQATYCESCPPGPDFFRPGNLTQQCDVFHFWSFHSGGAYFVFCDGSTKFLAYSANDILPSLATRAGAEVVP